LSLSELAPDVKALEEQIIEKVQESGREFYGKVLPLFRSAGLPSAGAVTGANVGARLIRSHLLG
jgi:hypothetical protein